MQALERYESSLSVDLETKKRELAEKKREISEKETQLATTSSKLTTVKVSLKDTSTVEVLNDKLDRISDFENNVRPILEGRKQGAFKDAPVQLVRKTVEWMWWNQLNGERLTQLSQLESDEM